MNVLDGLPRDRFPCCGSQSITLLINSSLLLKQCPLNLNLRSAIVVVNFGNVPYRVLFSMRSLHVTFLTTLSILVYVPSSFFLSVSVKVHVLDPYKRTDSTVALKNSTLMLFVRFDFQILSSFCSAVQAFAILIKTHKI